MACRNCGKEHRNSYGYPVQEETKFPKWGIILIATALLLLVVVVIARASDFSEYTDSQIVEAIGKAENSVKYPYGIKSINTHGDKEFARRICLNSVRKNRQRWIKAGKPEDLINFISRRYCPISAPDDFMGLNRYWSDNVKHFLGRAKCI